MQLNITIDVNADDLLSAISREKLTDLEALFITIPLFETKDCKDAASIAWIDGMEFKDFSPEAIRISCSILRS